jgi:alginate O-acetyltransferase complex protein AlgJ
MSDPGPSPFDQSLNFTFYSVDMRSRHAPEPSSTNVQAKHRGSRRVLGFVAVTAMTMGSLTLTAVAQNANGLTSGKEGFIFSGLSDLNWYVKSQKPSDARVDANINLISQINKILAKRNIKLVFTMVPMVERVYENKLPESFKLHPSLKSFYQRKFPALKNAGIFAVDLNTAFMTSGKRYDAQFPMYMRQDNHWSSIGGVEASRLVAQAIRGKYGSTLDALPEVKYDITWGEPEAFNGNYYRALPETERAKLQRELFKPVNFQAQPSSDLFGERQTGISVVGTSFSENRTFGFVEGIAHHLSKEVVNNAEAGKGPWTPLFDYLNSDNFQNNPPKILVWEFPEAFMIRSMKPVDGADDWSRNYFLIQSAANLGSDCGNNGIRPTISSGVEFTTEAGVASSASTTEKSLVKYGFKNTLRIDQYLSLKVKSASTSSIYLETVSSKPNKYFANLGAYNVSHRVNIPLYTVADGKATAVNIRSAIGSDLTVEDVKLCQMPSELMKLLPGVREAGIVGNGSVIASDPTVSSR